LPKQGAIVTHSSLLLEAIIRQPGNRFPLNHWLLPVTFTDSSPDAQF